MEKGVLAIEGITRLKETSHCLADLRLGQHLTELEREMGLKEEQGFT